MIRLSKASSSIFLYTVSVTVGVYIMAFLRRDDMSLYASLAGGFLTLCVCLVVQSGAKSSPFYISDAWRRMLLVMISSVVLTLIAFDVVNSCWRFTAGTVSTADFPIGASRLWRGKSLEIVGLGLAIGCSLLVLSQITREQARRFGGECLRDGKAVGAGLLSGIEQLLKASVVVLRYALWLPFYILWIVSWFTWQVLCVMVVGYQPHYPSVLIRGRQIISVEQARSIAAQQLIPPDRGIWFGGVRLPTAAARSGIAVIGACGSGKTTFIERMFGEVLANLRAGGQQRALILDTKLETLSYLKSLQVQVPIQILHPLDQRGVAWDVAKDCRTPAAIEQLAATLIPEEKASNNRFFSDAARELVRAAIQYLAEQGDWWTLRDLVLLLRELDDLKYALAQSPQTVSVLHVLGDDITARNVFATLTNFKRRYETIAAAWANATERISVAGWVQSESILVLGLNEQVRHPLGAIYRVFLQLVTEALLDQPETPDVKSWLILDEVRHAGLITGLRSLSTNGRSRGSSLTLGFQDIEGMREVFGDKEANELVGQCSNVALLRIQSPATATYASQLLGEADWREYTVTRGKGTWSVAEHVVTRPLMHPGEFMGMPLAGPQNGTPGVYSSANVGVWAGAIAAAEIMPKVHAPRDRSENFHPRPDSAQILKPWSAAERARLKLLPITAVPSPIAATEKAKKLTFVGKRKPQV